MKGLSQVLDLSWLYFYTKVKPKTWLRPFVNTAPGLFTSCQFGCYDNYFKEVYYLLKRGYCQFLCI